eukprot:scaffold5662_cov149-Isochrysis_galbana.AAC.5
MALGSSARTSQREATSPARAARTRCTPLLPSSTTPGGTPTPLASTARGALTSACARTARCAAKTAAPTWATSSSTPTPRASGNESTRSASST